MLKLLIILFIIFITIHKSINMDMSKIKDIISLMQPSEINGLFCDNNDHLSFLSTFSRNGYMSRVQNTSTNNILSSYPLYAVYVLDLTCNDSINILKSANELKLFAFPNRWIILNEEDTVVNIHEYFIDTDILVDSDVSVVTCKENVQCVIQKVYKKASNLPVIFEDYGFWEVNIGYKILQEDTISASRRRNLSGTMLNTCIVITHNDSLKHLLDKRNKHIDSIAKSTWGYKNEKSEWSGMIGELTRNEADIGGTPLFITVDRVPIIEYIAMTTPTKSKFVFRQPKLSYVLNVFTLPFETTVWISALALVIVTATGLYLVTKWENRQRKLRQIGSNEPRLEASLSDVFFLAFGAVCQQGSYVIPQTVSGRIITILLFISLMFLYTSYSANIVALLQSSSTNIQTLNDLLHSRLQVGVDDTVFNHFYFPNASEPIRKAIYQQKVAPPGQSPRFFPIDEGIRKMRQGLFAFHMETGAGYKIVGETFLEDEKCGLQEIQYLQVPDPWIAIQKNSSYKEMLKIGLRKIRESGIQSREVASLYTKKPECISHGSSFVGVTIVDCYPAVIIFVVGIAIAFGVFILELIHYYSSFVNCKSLLC